jgi:N-acetylglucosaminyldiphosphoundecaprenol N-acetyl-beta-D-mannosaminyltransferase
MQLLVADSEALPRHDLALAGLDAPPRRVTLLGVNVTDVSRLTAIEMMEDFLQADDRRCRSMFFVNAHTLNLAADQPAFRDLLNRADLVVNDGTGARWAARQRGIELRANLNGTDLIPDFLRATAGRGYRYYMLGATAETIAGAAQTAIRNYPGWTLAGFHDGFLPSEIVDRVIDEINAADVDLLLVGMGNPLQEQWIERYQARLRVPLAIGVGGLFDFWVEKPPRAPLWVRRAGCEWMHKLLKQPRKWRRYLLGNPKFLYRMTATRAADLAQMAD